MADEKLLAWGDRLKTIVEEDLPARFRVFGQLPNTDATPGERLDALLEVWCSLVVEDDHDPVGARAEKFRQDITSRARTTATAFENALGAIEQDAYRLIQTNALPSTRFVVTAEFPPGAVGTINHSGKILATALPSALPPNHPYRALIPEKDLPRFGDGPYFVLGPARPSVTGHPRPRGWYRLSQIRYWSAVLAREQAEEEKKRKDEKLRQERMQEAAARNDPRWQLEHLRSQVAELERDKAALIAQRPPAPIPNPGED
jgi:hypothetical protein